MLKTPKCYNSTNIAHIAFRVVRIDFWAQFTSKIKLRFLILVLPPLARVSCLNVVAQFLVTIPFILLWLRQGEKCHKKVISH